MARGPSQPANRGEGQDYRQASQASDVSCAGSKRAWRKLKFRFVSGISYSLFVGYSTRSKHFVLVTLVIDDSSLRAVRAHVTKEALVVDLADGRSVSVPLGWYPRLMEASEEEKRQLRLIGSGDGIHWDLLDEDVSVEGIVAGRRSMESAESFRRWLQDRKEHGLAKS